MDPRANPPSDHKALDVPVKQQWESFNVMNDDDRRLIVDAFVPLDSYRTDGRLK